MSEEPVAVPRDGPWLPTPRARVVAAQLAQRAAARPAPERPRAPQAVAAVRAVVAAVRCSYPLAGEPVSDRVSAPGGGPVRDRLSSMPP